MTYTVTVEKRTQGGSKACRAFRAQGKMPAVVYGPNNEAETILLNTKEFEKIWSEAGESTVLTLSGLDKKVSVLIQDVAHDPLYGTPTHADFYAIQADTVVDVEVPLEFVGVSPAEKGLGGTLIKVMFTLPIKALPKDLPSEVLVDISSLVTFEDQLQVKDIKLPQGVVADAEPEEVVALVQAPREEEESEVSGDVASVEVEKKGKEEESASDNK
ncbi:TPA: 50S ribosomal protein L25 [Patescibacteria group bacterium]|nr:MAG: 50S ribosomal protein L25 [Parcubacteria group bacterium GW2011_GWD2_42_14]HCC05173.1 50S ribosomal protein L25 [Patescibacteria group bacterium]